MEFFLGLLSKLQTLADPIDYWVDENNLGLILWEEIYPHEDALIQVTFPFLERKERDSN
jgi:hypothetical protein